MEGAQSFDQPSNRDRLRRAVPGFLHIEIVDDLADPGHAGVLYTKAMGQNLEGAQLSLMAELSRVHVEGDVRSGGNLHEGKPCVLVDESPDEPGAGDAIDARSWPGDPAASLK